MQRLDQCRLYKTNSNFFFSKINEFIDDDENTENIGAFYFFTFPISCPLALVIAGLKTITDLVTREPLSIKEKEALITTISTLNKQDINRLVKEIVSYDAQSNASKKLIADLLSLPKQAKKEFNSISVDIHNTIKKNKLNDFVQNALYFFQNDVRDYNIILKDNYQFSQDEEQEFTAKKDALKIKLENAVRNRQIKLITTYLQDSKNIGKKMEHVIMNAVIKCVGMVTPTLNLKNST